MMPDAPGKIRELIDMLYAERVRQGLGRRTLGAKLSQLTLRSVGTCTKQLFAWETGEKVPTLVNLLPWMQALGFTLKAVRAVEGKRITDAAQR